MGPRKRPGLTGEGTEPPACRKAALAIPDQAQRSLCNTVVCRPRISLPFSRSVCEDRVFTVRFDDRRPAPRPRYDEARPQLSLAAGAPRNGDLKPAPSPRPVSGGSKAPGE